VKLLVVTNLDGSSRAVNTIVKYAQVGKELGHEVAVYGEQRSDITAVPYTLDVERFDYAICVVYEPRDFPDLPYLARLLDRMPRERRAIIDCTGRYNETIRVDHDFNHLERIDGHQGWEWIEGFQAVSDRILQPTLAPMRDDVQPFLFHGYDPAAVRRPYTSAAEGARAWSAAGDGAKNNGWQLRKPVTAKELLAVASRVSGVMFVNDVLLAEGDKTAGEQVAMNGLELPRVMGVSVSVGEALPLAQLRGAANDTSGASRPRKIVPIPVVPENC